MRACKPPQIFQISFHQIQLIKMQLTASKAKPKFQLSEKVRKNLEQVRQRLHQSENEIMSISSLSDDEQDSRETSLIDYYCPLVRQLLLNIQNPFKCVLIMPLLLKKSSILINDSDPVFEGTMFHDSLRPSLTAYLHSQTPYLQMKGNSSRLVDVFYKYLLLEENTLMEITLQASQNQENTIGTWFQSEGIGRMFKKYYHEPSTFTIFLSNFMYYGISYLFLTAARILKNDVRVIKHSDIPFEMLENIEVAYVKKYRLDCLHDSFSVYPNI